MKRRTKNSFSTIEQEIPNPSAVLLRRTVLVGYFPMSEIRPETPKINEKTSVFANLEAA